MDDDKFFSQYIAILDELSDKPISDTSLLIIFCEYISSNSEFKYNGSYLRDSLIKFKEKIDLFRKKKELIILFQKELLLKYNTLSGWYIIFDNVHILTPTFQLELLLSYEKHPYLSSFISKFNLFRLSPECISVRYVKFNMDNKKPEILAEFCEEQRIKINDEYSKIKLFSLVEKTLTLRNSLGQGENDAYL